MSARQKSIVQGRITNGTLFPQISAKIQDSIDQLAQKTFRDLHDAVNAVLALVVNDVEMSLGSNEREDGAADQEDPEEERRKGELLAKIQELKREHEELIACISSM